MSDVVTVSVDEYEALVASPFADELTADGVALVVVDDAEAELTPPGSLPFVVAAIGDEFGGGGPSAVDVVVGPDDLSELAASVGHAPIAARTLVTLLRSVEHVPVDDALALESAAYSTLQAGPEFAAWRVARTANVDQSVADELAVPPAPVLISTRDEPDGGYVITLNRPDRHNAIDRHLRDHLYAALATAVFDEQQPVLLRGNGPSFCSGGDLAEFGERPDPATAHVVRLARSPARLLHRLAGRTEVQIHGAALGGGIELAAFADRVVAERGTSIALPEIGLGLIPGAGGTVSITRRAGRQRAAALALTGRRIDSETALDWGLVDAIS